MSIYIPKLKSLWGIRRFHDLHQAQLISAGQAHVSALSWWLGGWLPTGLSGWEDQGHFYVSLSSFLQASLGMFLQQWQGAKRGSKIFKSLFEVSAYIKFVTVLLIKATYMAKLRINMGGHYQRVWRQRHMKNWGH